MIELLVVIAIIAILAAMLLPVLSKAKIKAQGIHCLNNMKQLQLGWYAYATDNNERLPANPDKGSANGNNLGEPPPNPWPAWVAGQMGGADSLNADKLVGSIYHQYGSIGGYTKNAALYHCAGDKSTYSGELRVRSVAMNSFCGIAGDPSSPCNSRTVRRRPTSAVRGVPTRVSPISVAKWEGTSGRKAGTTGAIPPMN